MYRIIQHIKELGLFFFLIVTFHVNSQKELKNNQFNKDSISKYLYDSEHMKQMIDSSDKFILNVQNSNYPSLVSEIPLLLFDFRIKRIKTLSKLKNKIFEDSIDYTNCDTMGLIVLKCFYDKKNILTFRYEVYNDGTEIYCWFNEFGFKTVKIEIHGSNYEEDIYIDNKLIKKISIFDKLGYLKYNDFDGRLILYIDYIEGKIDKGVYINHKDQQLTTLLW